MDRVNGVNKTDGWEGSNDGLYLLVGAGEGGGGEAPWETYLNVGQSISGWL